MKSESFEYATLEDIAKECRRLNLGVTFAEDIGVLYEPLEVGGRKVGNRLAIHPMEGSDATNGGKPGELTFRRWKRFAAGGAKLIWGEAAAVVPEGRSNPRQLTLSGENTMQIAELVKQTRQSHRDKFGTVEDLLIGIQLTHAGRHCFRNPTIVYRSPIHDPLSFLDKRNGTPLPENYPIATDDYLEQLEDRFVDAARVAREGGFDFVDIKQCHSYLLNELLAARARDGKYGGTFENRTRFVRNVARKIYEAVGDDIFIASRMNVFDSIPFMRDSETGIGVPVAYKTPYVFGWGVDENDPQREDLREPIRLIEILRGLGVQLFSISFGSPYWSPHFVRPFNRPAQGGYSTPEHPLVGVDRMFRLTGEIQGAFPSTPIVGAGYSWLRQFLLNAAAANVAGGKVTIVGAGRSALAYPDFAHDGQIAGKMDADKVCLADSMCSNMLKGAGEDGEKIPAGCPVRDSAYRDFYKLMK